MEFTLKATFNTTSKNLYKLWLNSEGHEKITGGEATASAIIGEEFTAWDGYIEGRNIELVPFSKIVQSWRTSQFETDERDSQIEIRLKDVNGKTELTLIHTNVPESGEHYKNGWENHYFQPMKDYFG